ncbi:pyrimidine-nucleoside phosphorylase [Ruminococcaceae bacterium YRB3002]|nr:pyrimidine-nucleoside phosphorylase [Ruminococcaceae bacterium YRB3002]
MSFVNMIEKKRYNGELTDEEIRFFVKGVTDGSIPDYQISALLMAIVLNGMNDREMTTLTLAMADSGERQDLSFCDDMPVDKHSTGGVGDKVTPLLLPLLATYGITSVKLSGRGLGFTGGTIDKFESIKGFNTSVPADDFPRLIRETGMVLSAQTPDLAPADKVLYSLRDVTGTVDSIPLIASSIMSKKIAGGAKALVLDVTCGSGAFMKTVDRAEELARAMISIGKLAGIKTVVVISDMDQPLGRTCGNTLEMQEVMETLTGKGAPDVIKVVCTIARELIKLAGKDNGMDDNEIYDDCVKRLTSGEALASFIKLVSSQGGEITMAGPSYVELPHEALRISAPSDGYVKSIRTDAIGSLSVLLGAGRATKTDTIDYGAGICFYAKVGDHVKRGDVLCSLCHGVSREVPEELLFDVMEKVYECYEFSDTPVEERDPIIKVLD